MVFIGGETLQVYFLGTAGAMPTPHRNPPSIMIRRGSDTLLFDCGEGTQQQMMRARTGFLVQSIFITHWHADHFLGIFGLLQSLSFMGRTDLLTIYGPEGCNEFVHAVRQLFRHQIRFPVQPVTVTVGDRVLCDGYSIYVIGTEHGIPSVGYILVEDTRPGRFNRDRAIDLGVPPGPLFGRLQRGESVRVVKDGISTEIRPVDVMGPPRQGRKIIYTGDTRPVHHLWGEVARYPDLLIHDATFITAETDRAREVFHSTAGEAGEAAENIQARTLALLHISSRYTETSTHIQDAKQQFSGEVIAPGDLTMVDILFRD